MKGDGMNTSASESQASAGGTSDEAEELQRIRHMPKEVGVLLVVAGIGGLLLPGPIGSPFVILGGVILWPSVFERLEIAFEKRFPRIHRQSVRQIGRFLNDLERRYPLPR
jgi:hypothetical protein